MKAANK